MEASIAVEEAPLAFERVPYGASAAVQPAKLQPAKLVKTAQKWDWLRAMLILGPALAMYGAIGYAAYALIALLA
jgi:hypothetical protein